jgi:hypothetical protein
MSRLTPSSRRSPCPLCGDIKGKCRSSDGSLLLCMTLTEAIDAPPGWRYCGQTQGAAAGLWGCWLPTDSLDEAAERQRWLALQEHQQRQRQQRANGLPVAVRDRDYRALLAALPLAPADAADLERRGLSPEQIARYGYRSVERQQPLPSGLFLDAQLPGVIPGQSHLAISSPGYLIPIPDVDGRIQALQLRRRPLGLQDPGGGRYRWFSSSSLGGTSPHLPNGELPLGVFWPEGEAQRQRLYLSEGFLKAQLAALRLGAVVLGADGGNFAARPESFNATLAQLAERFAASEGIAADASSAPTAAPAGPQVTFELTLLVDGGAIANRHVLSLYRRVQSLVEATGYRFSFLWWGQRQKGLDVDEVSAEVLAQAQALSPEQFWALVPAALQPAEPQRPAPRCQPALLQPHRSPVLYELDERLAVWAQHLLQGGITLDASGTGTGKSFDAGRLSQQLEQLGFAGQVFYLSHSYRNPSVDTLEPWTPLQGRHSGLGQINGQWKPLPLGSDRLPERPANCSRTQTIAALRDKNIPGADTRELICERCPMLEACQHSSGPGYGFLHERHQALKQRFIRCHPHSLPGPETDWSESILILEEAGLLLQPARQISITPADLDQVLAQLVEATALWPELLELVRWLLQLKQTLSTQHGRHGLSHRQTVEALGRPAVEARLVDLATAPSLACLDLDPETGVSLADLPRQLRRRLAERDGDLARAIAREVPLQWLPHLLGVLRGEHPGASLHLQRGRLTLSLPEGQLAQICRQAKAVLLLDATPLLLEESLGLEPGQATVLQVRQEQAGAQVRYLQCADFGLMGQQRGQDQLRRRDALLEALTQQHTHLGVIDLKRHSQDGWLHWFSGSRGSNAYQDCDALVLVGAPLLNVHAALAHYRALQRCDVNDQDPAFRRWYAAKVAAELVQAINRLRANRRPGHSLTVYLLTNLDLSQLGLPIEALQTAELLPEAAPKAERTLAQAIAAARQLLEQGQKLTRRAVAAIVGVTEQWIGRLWQQLQAALETTKLLPVEQFNSKSFISDDSPGPTADVAQVLEALALGPLDPPAVADLLVSAGASLDLEHLCGALSPPTRDWLQATLAAVEETALVPMDAVAA